jgi:hypothetical protein
MNTMFNHLLIALAAFALVTSIANAAGNPIFDELTSRGVTMANTVVRLPPPSMPDGLSSEDQQKALARIAGEKQRLSAMLRKAVVAPQILRLKDEPAAGAIRPRRVDLWFVAYGDIERLSDEDFLRQQVEAEAESNDQASSDEGRVLKDEELAKRSISPKPGERFLAARFILFDRVQISGAMRSMLTRSADSVTAASVMDRRFDKDAEFPNAWRPIVRDEAGRTSFGQQHAYDGAGWYAKATKLAQPPGAALVEVHAVFDEPEGWFNGANLLRSKLPLVTQDNVRKFRRRLSAAGQ